MDKSIEVEALLADLESNAPDVYTKCIVSLPDKKGVISEKKCILNLKTGDVFKSRKIAPYEATNFRIVRAYNNYDDCIVHFAFQNAQIVDENIILATWVFGDYVNYPMTNKLEVSWCDPTPLDGLKRGNPHDPDALLNIVLSEPKIAAMVMVSKNKEVFTWEDADKYGCTGLGHRRNAEFLSTRLVNTLYHVCDASNVCDLTECFKSLFEVGYCGANKYLTFDSYKDVPLFMKGNPMQVKSGKQQKRIDELAAIKLPDHTVAAMTEKTICYADRVNDEWTVLRWWINTQPAKYVETSRLYVNKTEALRCCSDLDGHWIYAAAKLKATTFNADRVILQTSNVLDGTKLEYFKSISTEMANQSAALYMLTMYPEFEKMCKSGLEWLCNNYLKNPYQQSWKNYLEERVRDVNWDAKNIMQMIGVNRHQIDALSEFRKKIEANKHEQAWYNYHINSIIQIMKRIFGVSALNSIDNETFDYILNSITINRLQSVYVHALAITFAMYHQDAMYFVKDLNAVAKSGNRQITVMTRQGYTSHMNADSLYYDTMRMIQSGSYMDVIRPRFSTIEELVNHHEVMVDLINADQVQHEARVNEQYNEGFKTNHERWKKWEWDGDETFCVIAPSKPVDVAVEGITLRHCVKSYIPSISQGQTNIMFIRRKGKESEPFFTIEVDTTNRIRQVHGMCNCNVETVEGLPEFVTKWSKMKKLKYNATTAHQVRAVG